MLEGLPGLPLALAVLAVAPAALSWWRDRALRAAADDPALPERLIAARQQHGAAAGIGLGVLIVASPSSLLWTAPLLGIAQVIAAYSLHKFLYGGTWGIGGYLSFVLRCFVAFWGFWIALSFLPLAAYAAAPFEWAVAVGLALLLIVWNAWFAEILTWLMRVKPLEDAALLDDFGRLVRASGIRPPRFVVLDVGGSSIANALALPSLRQSYVIFTPALLARLDRDEVSAICAHELAHLEHFTPRLLRRLNRMVYLMIGAAIVIGCAPRLVTLPSPLVAILVWVGCVVAFLVWRAHDRQANETAADKRAVALCGDGEVMIRALTKIHNYSRFPRRLDPELEQRSTHPSLARRLRDIRAAAGTSPVALAKSCSFSSENGRVAVRFEVDRLEWRDGDLATHSFSYSYLSEVRLHVTARGATSLVVADRGGRRLEMPVAAAEIARLQTVLDDIDGRIGGTSSRPGLWPILGRTILSLGAVVGLALNQIAVAIVLAIAAARPSSPLLAGAAMAALSGTALAWRSPDATPSTDMLMMALLVFAGGWALWGAILKRDEPMPARTGLGVIALGIGALASTLLFLFDGLDPIELYQSAVGLPSAPVFVLALGTTLACWPSRAARIAARPAIAFGFVCAAAGSTLFLDSFGRDPFLQPSSPLRWTALDRPADREFDVPYFVSEMWLSPGARSIILASAPDTDPYEPEYFVGRPGLALTAIDATHLVFLDDERLLAATVGEDSTWLREIRIDVPEQVVWHQRLEGISGATLSYRKEDRRWQLVGGDHRGIVRASGTVGSPDVERMRWPAPLDASLGRQALAALSDTVLLFEREYATPFSSHALFWFYLSLTRGMQLESTLSMVDGSGRRELTKTKLDANCSSSGLDFERLLCSAFDGTRTHLLWVDGATGAVTPVGWLRGRFTATDVPVEGWLSGWVDWNPVAIHLSTGEVLHIPRPDGRTVNHITAAGDLVGAIGYGESGSRVRLYSRRTPALLAEQD